MRRPPIIKSDTSLTIPIDQGILLPPGWIAAIQLIPFHGEYTSLKQCGGHREHCKFISKANKIQRTGIGTVDIMSQFSAIHDKNTHHFEVGRRDVLAVDVVSQMVSIARGYVAPL